MNTTHQHVRINERLQAYWDEVRGESRMPDESDIAPEALEDIWPNCFLIDVKNSGFEYDYLGDNILDAYGDDIRGRAICESLVYPHPPKLLEAFQDVIRTLGPVQLEETFTNAQGVEIRFRSCVLPLTKKGDIGVQFILGGMKWKAS